MNWSHLSKEWCWQSGEDGIKEIIGGLPFNSTVQEVPEWPEVLLVLGTEPKGLADLRVSAGTMQEDS